MMVCPSTRSEVRGALAKTVMLYLHLVFLFPTSVFGPATKVHLLPSGETEQRIVAYGLMQSAKNPCITGFEAAEVGARPVQRGSSTISIARTLQVRVFSIAESY